MIEWAPLLTELLTLAVIGVSGVAGGLSLGWRNPFLLAAAAVAVSGVVRVVTTLAVWSLGQYSLMTEAWWVVSGVLAAVGVLLITLKFRKEGGVALIAFGALALAALATKYVLAIGERHHRDSVSAVETALLLFQGELDPTVWGPEEKRGLAYPLMLALGPDGRLLSAVTPLIFLSLLLAVVWLGREMTRETVPTRWFLWSVAIVGVFSLTVPIFRVSLTYLNAHIYMALGVLLIVAGGLIATRHGRFDVPTAGLVSVGVIIATTARVEGIVTVGVLLAWLASMKWLSTWRDRGLLFLPIALSGLVLSWWLGASGSEVPASFGVSPLLVAGVTVMGAALVITPVVDRVRFTFLPLVVTVVFALLIRVPLTSDNPVGIVMTQFNNVVRGYGGWGVAALALGVAVVVLGWRSRSEAYRSLMVLSGLLIFTTLFSKLFDGDGFGAGFGRDGFYDSVNRMWLHTLGVVAVTMVVGFAEFLRDVAARRAGGGQGEETTPDYTSNRVSDAKDSVS